VHQAIGGHEEVGQAIVQLEAVEVDLALVAAGLDLQRQILEQLLQPDGVTLVDHDVALGVPLVGDPLRGECLHHLVLGGGGQHGDLVGHGGQLGVEGLDRRGDHLLHELVDRGLVLPAHDQHGALPHMGDLLVVEHPRQQPPGLARPGAAVVGDPADVVAAGDPALVVLVRFVLPGGLPVWPAEGLVAAHAAMLPRLGCRWHER
jgi:hypothetical protein